LALDVHSGKVLWDHAINGKDAPNSGLQLSSGPLVARGMVMIGASLGLTSKGGCFIVALDAATGEERWRFYTVARPGTAAEAQPVARHDQPLAISQQPFAASIERRRVACLTATTLNGGPGRSRLCVEPAAYSLIWGGKRGTRVQRDCLVHGYYRSS
jgi:glucose dehydrogenase